MAYPNRSHGIYEGKNTRRHLYTLLTGYLNEHCPAGEDGVNVGHPAWNNEFVLIDKLNSKPL